jgi:hypothetical protein
MKNHTDCNHSILGDFKTLEFSNLMATKLEQKKGLKTLMFVPVLVSFSCSLQK